jgi:hypothetical protein
LRWERRHESLNQGEKGGGELEGQFDKARRQGKARGDYIEGCLVRCSCDLTTDAIDGDKYSVPTEDSELTAPDGRSTQRHQGRSDWVAWQTEAEGKKARKESERKRKRDRRRNKVGGRQEGRTQDAGRRKHQGGEAGMNVKGKRREGKGRGAGAWAGTALLGNQGGRWVLLEE